RVERGADLALRLDELPPLSAAAALVVVSGYSLSVEPARSAALGALTTARARGARAALWLDAQLLRWTNARITRRVPEPAIAAADRVALQEADARAHADNSSRRCNTAMAPLEQPGVAGPVRPVTAVAFPWGLPGAAGSSSPSSVPSCFRRRLPCRPAHTRR